MPVNTFAELFMELPEIRFVGDFVVKAGWSLGPRTLKTQEIVYFPNGTRTVYNVDGRGYQLNKPCIIFARPGESHSYRFDPQQPSRHLFIRFQFGSINVFPTLSSGEFPMIELEDTSIVPLLIRHIMYLATEKPAQWKEKGNLLLLSCLQELEEMPRVKNNVIQTVRIPFQISEAIQFIDNYSHLTLTVADIARYTGWSSEHLSRQFAKYIGVSPKRIIMRKRIEKACELLVHEQWSIKEIAYAVGFHDERHFYRSFAQVEGMTAKQYREKHSNHRAKHLTIAKDSFTNHPINRFLYFDRP